MPPLRAANLLRAAFFVSTLSRDVPITCFVQKNHRGLERFSFEFRTERLSLRLILRRVRERTFVIEHRRTFDEMLGLAGGTFAKPFSEILAARDHHSARSALRLAPAP